MSYPRAVRQVLRGDHLPTGRVVRVEQVAEVDDRVEGAERREVEERPLRQVVVADREQRAQDALDRAHDAARVELLAVRRPLAQLLEARLRHGTGRAHDTSYQSLLPKTCDNIKSGSRPD